MTLKKLITWSVLACASSGALAHGPELHLTPAFDASRLLQADAAMRDLWGEHAFWVRGVVAATMSGDRAAAAAAEGEAVRNAQQIAAALEGFYGKAAAEKLFGLLAGHYGAVKQLAEATLAGDATRQEAARNAMIANAGELAGFLAAANPHLPLDAVRGALLMHGGHHILQITQLHGHQYAEEAKTWGEMRTHMYAIADTMTSAIALQFPAKFR